MSDYIVRATAAGNMVRAFACTTKDTVEYARNSHNTSPVVTAALGRLLSAGLMMGSMMKGDADLITLKIHGDGPLQGIVVTADSKGHVKGYPFNPLVIIPANEKGKLDVSGAIGSGVLNVISDIGLKEPYSGQVNLVSGEIAEDLTYYYATSEQVPSSVALGVLMNKNNTVKAAGGFIIQLMPDCPEEVISVIENKIGSIKSITSMLSDGMTPEEILAYVLSDLGLVINDTMECSFSCNCDRERVEKALISVGSEELQSMIDDGKNIEVNCHFCNKAYNFQVSEIRTMLKQAREKSKEED